MPALHAVLFFYFNQIDNKNIGCLSEPFAGAGGGQNLNEPPYPALASNMTVVRVTAETQPDVLFGGAGAANVQLAHPVAQRADIESE